MQCRCAGLPGTEDPRIVKAVRAAEKDPVLQAELARQLEFDQRNLAALEQVTLPQAFDYLAYIAQATPTGWAYRAYGWGLRDPMPPLPIPLLGNDHAILDLGACFRVAYDAIAADEEAGYTGDPPPPPLRSEDRAWVDTLLREKGLRV